MPLRQSAAIALIFALVVAASIRPAGAGQASDQVTGYYVCELSVSDNGGKTSTLYLSDVIPNTGFRPGPVAAAFRNTLSQVNTKQPAACFEHRTEADARQLLQQSAHPGEKLVLTGWKYSAGGAASAMTAPSPTTPATPPPQPDKAQYGAPGPTGPLQGYCFEYAMQKLFITKLFLYGRPTGEGVTDEFSAFVAKTYGAPAGATARCAALRIPKEVIENTRQNEINDARRTPSLQLVEIDWVPAPKPATPAQTPAPTAAPQPNASASAAAKPAALQTVDTYSYCYAYGTPQGPGNGKPRRQHYYVTPLFARSATDRPDGDWQKFIRAAHTDEAFNASCTSPGPSPTAEKARTDQLASMSKLANFDVVEVDWKR